MTEPLAVADAGPLIHLDEIGFAAALDIFPVVLVPQEVASEIQMRPRGPGHAALEHCQIIPAAQGSTPMGSLSVADVAAIGLARERDGLLLTDDLDLRDMARLAGVPVVGTIGVMVRAGRTGAVPRTAAMAALDALLTDSTLFITPGLIRQAQRALDS